VKGGVGVGSDEGGVEAARWVYCEGAEPLSCPPCPSRPLGPLVLRTEMTERIRVMRPRARISALILWSQIAFLPESRTVAKASSAVPISHANVMITKRMKRTAHCCGGEEAGWDGEAQAQLLSHGLHAWL
jgi:hypothetical protein